MAARMWYLFSFVVSSLNSGPAKLVKMLSIRTIGTKTSTLLVTAGDGDAVLFSVNSFRLKSPGVRCWVLFFISFCFTKRIVFQRKGRALLKGLVMINIYFFF